MQHAVGECSQPTERGCVVEITDQRQCAGRAQCWRTCRRRSQRQDPMASAQKAQHAQADIAATDDQQDGATGT
jgi:hypothetical protein